MQPTRSLCATVRLAVLVAAVAVMGQAPADTMPKGAVARAPVSGPVEPKVRPVHDENGLYRQAWFALSFLDLREDFAETAREGKRLAVVFEQHGCPYCKRLHTEVLAERYINDYVRENFRIVQIDLWGARDVTDFDGKVMSERALAERWGILFTPTVVFFKDDLAGLEGKWGRELEAVERLPLSFGSATFYDLFVWVRERIYERDRNFQRFHIARLGERAGR
ncbi:MAG: thioredoxin family protein [Hyphomicrobiaceae bacterium]|nr:thioredoxin family protein [Hyphomicrobiaceae bacterium]